MLEMTRRNAPGGGDTKMVQTQAVWPEGGRRNGGAAIAR
jgi:hypothetical protein